MLKRILLALDGTPYTAVAIQFAVKIGKRFDAEITGVTVLKLDRLKNVSIEQKESTLAGVNRAILTRDRIEEAPYTDPYVRWCGRESPRGLPYADLRL